MNSNANHSNRPNPSIVSQQSRTRDQQDRNPRSVLLEVYQLLEDYAPTWYLESHSRRIRMALDTLEA